MAKIASGDKITPLPHKQGTATAAPTRLNLPQLRERAIALHQQGKARQAAQAYHLYLTLNPADAGMWSNFGALLRKQQQQASAIGCYKRALAISPNDPGVLSNLGNALEDVDRLEEAVQCQAQAVALEPNNNQYRLNYAVALREAKQFEAAKTELNHLLAQQPNNACYRWDRAIINLYLGNYSEGWADYEARWEACELSVPPFKCPRWQGETLKPGQTLALLAEQGFGDTIFAARFIPLVRERLGEKANIVLICETDLHKLFSKLPINALLTPEQAFKPGIKSDAWVPLMSLMGIFNITHENPPPPATLHISEEARTKFAPLAKRYANQRKIGIVWSGSQTFKDNAKRACSLTHFLPLAEQPNVQLFSLQKGAQQQELYRNGAAPLIFDLAPQLNDFADTAAAIEILDEIIMTDSSVAHLAGSLGKKVTNLLQYKPYWLYGANGERTKWYPAMEMKVQERAGEWVDDFVGFIK